MKKIAIHFNRLVLYLGLIAYSSLCVAGGTSPPSGHFVRDASQQVYFDQFLSNTFSLQLLKVRNKFTMQEMVVGGSTQLDLQTWKGNKIATGGEGSYQDGNGLYLTQAQLDFMSNFNSWSSIFLSVTDSHIEAQSNYVFTQHAFILLGNLEKAPVYLTLGINTIPFGQFNPSGPWNAPLTGSYFNPLQAPQVSLGFYKYDLNAVATTYDDEINHNQNYAYALFYNKVNGKFSYNLGVGYLSDLKTNAAGTNTTKSVSKKSLAKLNMGGIYDFNGGIGYGKLSASGEFVYGNKKVANNKNPPQALGLVLSYVPHIFGADTTFALGYSSTLNLKNVPTTLMGYDAILSASSGLKKDWSLNVSRSIVMDNFVLGFDVEREDSYSGERTYVYTLDLMSYL